MQLIGFVLLCIGLAITLGARRIVLAKTKLDKEDKEEIEILAAGAIIAVRLAGFVVAAIGLVFLMLMH
ncbi:hypothetical protein CS063_03935 [Sporanaerobium hydrogeniformans]|uniref:Uncharacterized protein n=1 Tax=Sporanaerobium hydrogeniformans TaxID=3072179 RepID=A0AC61DEJ9_9FIRM|nr:hypothetical protein [Sporanaerobium hydrogeniformans]PHV71719.1 hypothetical protein CS063_03935 [Sporanaerobium hydrogeniformans]